MTAHSPPSEKSTTKPGPLARISDFYIALSIGTYHRGIDDAKNIAAIIKEMLG